MRLFARHRPTPRDDPVLRLSARDEHDLNAVPRDAVREGSILGVGASGLTSAWRADSKIGLDVYPEATSFRLLQ